MKHTIGLIILAAWAACPLPSRGESEPAMVDGVVAYVDQHIITVGDVMEAIEPVRRKLMASLEGAPLKEKLEAAFRDALQNLIERRLILDAFEADKGQLPEWVVDQRVNELVRDLFNDDRDALLAALAKDHLSYEKWRSGIRDQIIVASMRKNHVEQNVRVPASAIRQEYDAHPDAYRTDPKVKLRMMAMKTGSDGGPDRRADMEALRARVMAGEDFAALATEHSEESKARSGGDWGWVDPARTLRAELAEAVQALAPGEVSGVVDTGDMLYLVKVEDRQEAVVTSFEESRAAIEQALRRAESDRLYREWIARLTRDAYVKVLDVGAF